MREYRFDIDESYMDRFFSPIKNKAQFIELLMNSLKYMLLNQNIKKERVRGEIILIIDKMSRLFFVKDKKCFSIVFPFSVKYEDVFSFSFKNRMNIDGRLTSEVISFINDSDFESNCSIEFASSIYEYQESNDDSYWDLIRELLLMEGGYLRYDHDPNNYEKHNKSDVHPLNHFDLFYSSNATFKIGLKGIIEPAEFIDLLNVKTVCKFIG
tara:strand:+ start:1276 stop:1908 length:633 start_codon:yes stop_codon:yes gene_type:complete